MSEAANTKTFLVMTFLSIRQSPGLSGQRLPRYLGSGAQIQVRADSRTEKDGFIWWEHDAGWSAEAKLDGSATYLKLIKDSSAGTGSETTEPDTTTDTTDEGTTISIETSGGENGDTSGDTNISVTPPTTVIVTTTDPEEPDEPKRFKVLQNLSIRKSPSTSAERTADGQLAGGMVITVIKTSRTEADGYVWWQHDKGWSAEAKIDGSDTFLGDPDTKVPGAISFTSDGLPDVTTLPQRDALVERMPVDLASTKWVQYFGNTQFAFKNGKRWNYDSFAQGLHSGFDFGNSNPAGVPVYAGVHGTFIRNNRYGIAVRAGDYVLIYQHLYKNTTYVAGGAVTPDTVMGEMTQTDVHLHFEIRYSAEKWIINPLLMMSEAMRNSLMQKFPTFTRHFQPYPQWQTPMEQPIIVRGGPVIGPRG